MKKEITIYNLLRSIIIFIIGIILITNPNALIGTLSWIIGSLLIVAGIIKTILSYKDNNLYASSLYAGILIIIVGIFLISFPQIINITIRIIFGGWILFAGIERSVLAMALKSLDRRVSNTFLISSLIMVVIGVLVLINFYNLIGILLTIYAVVDVIDYIYYSAKKFEKPAEKTTKKKSKNNKKIDKDIKAKDAIDADIDED